MKYYAVIDTNVIVSAMLKWTSVPGSILEFAFSGTIIPVLNKEIVDEYREVLSRDKFHLRKEIVDDVIYELALQAQQIRAQFSGVSVAELNPQLEIDALPPGEYREQQTKIRIGQYFFRMAVLNAYGGRCCITGIGNSTLLRASHIKPWKDSDAKTERTNPCNGVCLNPLHDVAFDKGLITFDTNYRVIVSKELLNSNMDEKTRKWFMAYSGKEIALPEKFYPDKSFIQYHNDVIFRG